jgi:predicted house-cleaning noncanonical NTP pyrophosphatase (MazG superfamily)
VIYNKLVRDLIPEYLDSKGVAYTIHVADETEYRNKLYQKLAEEVVELTEEPSIEEMADLQEVIRAICAFERWKSKDIEENRKKKETDRGGFLKRIILEES